MNKNVNQYIWMLVFEKQNRKENWIRERIMFMDAINKEHL